MDEYQVLIGLEMHCEISETNTKVFSSARNDYSDIPNTNIQPVDMAFPGTLPVVNKEAVKLALKASMILHCTQPEYIFRKKKLLLSRSSKRISNHTGNKTSTSR